MLVVGMRIRVGLLVGSEVIMREGWKCLFMPGIRIKKNSVQLKTIDSCKSETDKF